MEDWRIENEKEFEEFYKGNIFLQIIFPEFWQRAYKTKNRFFDYVFEEAKRHVALLGKYEEFLVGDRCREFWHRHCSFCLTEISTDMHEECYCAENGSYWVCKKCFHDFKNRYNWKVIENIQDIPESGFIPLAIEIAK